MDKADAARRRGARKAAIGYYAKALNADPSNADTHNDYGELLAAEAHLSQAIKHFRAAVKISPETARSHINLGKALFLNGNQASGAAAFEESVQLAPNDAEPRFLLGSSYRRMGDPNRALGQFQACIELDARRVDAHYHLGLIHKTLGRLAPARAAFADASSLAPENGYVRAAVESLEAAEAGRDTVEKSSTARRIGLHMSDRSHFPVLSPLFSAMRDAHWPLLTADGRELLEFEPDAVLLCGPRIHALRQYLPAIPFVDVLCGLTSRRFDADDGMADFICASSPDEGQDLIERAGLTRDQLLITGYVGNDMLFQGAPPALAFDLPEDFKTVLYAPTWQPSLTSAAMLGENVVDLIRGKRRDLSVIICPDPLMYKQHPDWIAAWQRLAENDPNVHLAVQPETDVVPLLRAADVLVSDAAGAIMQFLALDRPVVLINNPNRTKDTEHYHADSIEWRARDIGVEIDDPAELAVAVAKALDDPGLGSEGRTRHRAWLFGGLTDGAAGARIIERVAALTA